MARAAQAILLPVHIHLVVSKCTAKSGCATRTQSSRQADVVFGQRLRSGPRTGEIFEFGKLPALVEGVVVMETMQHRSHPPGKTLHFPDPVETSLRIFVEPVRAARAVELGKRARENANIGDGQVQPFGASGRNDVGSVAR